MLKQTRRRLFGISLTETTVATRGFTVTDEGVRHYLEEIGRIFVLGYHAALLDDNPDTLAARLNREVDDSYTGFAFEGAGMGLALLDMLTPWSGRRVRRFLDGPANHHYYMVHVGVGWAMARLHRRVDGMLRQLDPVVGWLAIEGYGFHETYFDWPRTITRQERPQHLTGYACRAFDQGIGRCLWFVYGADPYRIAATVASYDDARRADLWGGVGLAAGYAGGVDAAAITALADAAGSHGPQLAQGIAFAAATRQRAGNPAAHSELACQLVCGMSLDDTAQLAFVQGENLPEDGPEPAWEVWCQRVQSQFAEEVRPPLKGVQV